MTMLVFFAVAQAQAQTPSAPTNVRATVLSPKAIQIVWTFDNQSSTGIRFDFEIKETAEGEDDWRSVDSVQEEDSGPRRYTFRDLTPGTSYDVGVTACESGCSARVTATVATPATGVEIDEQLLESDFLADYPDYLLTVTLVGVEWEENHPTPADITISGVPGLTVGTVDPSLPSVERYDDMSAGVYVIFDGRDIDTDRVLRLTVRANAHTGSGNLTTTLPFIAEIETAPEQVTGVVVTEQDGYLTVSWDELADANSFYTYKVQWKSGSQGYAPARQHILTGDTGDDTPPPTTVDIAGLAPGTEYAVRVIAARAKSPDAAPSMEHTGTPEVATTPTIAVRRTSTAVAVAGRNDITFGFTLSDRAFSGPRTVNVEIDLESTGGSVLQGSGGDYVVVETETGERIADTTGGSPRAVALEFASGKATWNLRTVFDHLDGHLDNEITITLEAGTGYEVVGGDKSAAVTVRDSNPDLSRDVSVVERVTLTPGVSTMEVEWTPVPWAVAYEVQWRPEGGRFNTNARARIEDTAVTSYVFGNIQSNQKYEAWVSVRSEHYESFPTKSDLVWPLLAAPQQVMATAGAGSLTVSWNTVSGASGYRVQWKSEADGDYFSDREQTVTGESMTMHTIPNLRGDTTYTVRVAATSSEDGQEGQFSQEATTTLPAEPDQVTGVTVTAGVRSLGVSWTAVQNADGYIVEWKSGSQDYEASRRAEVTGTNHRITGLAAGTRYTVQVTATFPVQADGPPSAEKAGVPLSPPPPPPPPPALVEVLVPEGGEVKIGDGGLIEIEDIGGDPDRDLRVTLPRLTASATMTVRPADLSGETPPEGVIFHGASAVLISLSPPLPQGTTATVCLRTDPDAGEKPSLYRATGSPVQWEAIGTDMSVPGFVCGETDGFSPFAVGYPNLVEVLVPEGGEVKIGDGGLIEIEDIGGDPDRDLRITLPRLTAAATMTVRPADLSGETPPEGVIFHGASAVLISLSPPLPQGTTATVCLRAAADAGGEPSLYRATGSPVQWEAIGTDTSVPGFVCGETDGFSPFAVGYPDLAPTFGNLEPIEVSWVRGEEIEPGFALPRASGGNPPLSYALSPALPRGLAFDAEALTVSGTPEEYSRKTAYTLTATDTDGDEGSFGFTIEVRSLERERYRRVGEVILPEMSRAMTANVMDAITGRVEDVRNGLSERRRFAGSFAGHGTLSSALAAREWEINEGEIGWRDMLDGSSFSVTLAGGMPKAPVKRPTDPGPVERPADPEPVESGTVYGPARVTVWGRGDYRDLSGGGPVSWDGEMFSASLGTDFRVGESGLAGVALSRSSGSFDFTEGGTSGDYGSRMISAHPYLGWFSPGGGGSVWATAGYGWGEVEIEEGEDLRQKADSSMKTVGGGASLRLLSGGSASFDIKGEGWFTRLSVEDNGEFIEGLSVDARRARLALEAALSHALSSGATLRPSVEIGVRHDGGDGETGTGLEAGGGIAYSGRGLSVEVEGRALVAHQGDISEWGIGGSVRYGFGRDGRGLNFAVNPSWGDTASGVERLWDGGLSDYSAPGDSPLRLDAEAGYGVAVMGGDALLTPTATYRLSGNEERRYGIGSRLGMGQRVDIELEGHRTEKEPPEHGVEIRARLRW